MKTLLILLVGLFPLTAYAQTQINDELIGEFNNDLFGSSVAVSEDGMRVVVGSITNSEAFASSGQVQVFENIGDTWVQVGQDINGTGANGNLGRGIAISDDGTIIAMGADGFGSNRGKARVFEFSNGSWIQQGQDLLGSETGARFGNEVSLSADGSIVAVGAPTDGNNMGAVSVFQNQGGTWVQLGNDIEGDVADLFGNGLDLSADGLRVACGGDSLNFGPGLLRVFDFTGFDWTQVGQTIIGLDNFECLGGSVSLSDDGFTVAVSAIGNVDAGVQSGAIRVFRDTGGTWTQIGDDINGTLLKQLGASLSLSSDGTVLAAGAFGDGLPGTVNKDGTITPQEGPSEMVFRNEGDVWVELANIPGEPGSFFGLQSHLSSDGLTVAVGAQSFDGNGFNRGVVRVFCLEDILVSSVPPTNVTVFRGTVLSNELSAYAESDDVRAEFNPGFTIGEFEAPVWLIFDAVAPTTSSFELESSAGTPGLTYTIEAFNFDAGSYDVIGTMSETFNSELVDSFDITPADHIDTDGNVQARVGWRRTGFTINFPWTVLVDQFSFVQ